MRNNIEYAEIVLSELKQTLTTVSPEVTEVLSIIQEPLRPYAFSS